MEDGTTFLVLRASFCCREVVAGDVCSLSGESCNDSVRKVLGVKDCERETCLSLSSYNFTDKGRLIFGVRNGEGRVVVSGFV